MFRDSVFKRAKAEVCEVILFSALTVAAAMTTVFLAMKGGAYEWSAPSVFLSAGFVINAAKRMRRKRGLQFAPQGKTKPFCSPIAYKL